MKRLSGTKIAALAVALCGCWAYLCFFFLRLLDFFGLPSPVLALLAGTGCMVLGLWDPIPVKMRTVFCMYLGFYGIITDVVALVLTAPLYTVLHRSGALVVLLTALSVLYGRHHGRKTVQRSYTVPSPLSHPMRIALLSDIHMGYTVDEACLRDVLAQIEAQRPDLLVVAGDLSDDTTSLADLQTAARLLGQMSCPVVSVLGNHDLGEPKPQQYTEAQYRATLAENGIRLLDDTAADMGDYVLLGRRDSWMEGRKDTDDLPRSAKPRIVIDHQPFSYKENAALGFLQLSGHTHAWQVFPLSLMGRVLPGFYGLHRREDMTLITSCGLGNRGNRLRSGCTAEYVIIDLVPEEEG